MTPQSTLRTCLLFLLFAIPGTAQGQKVLFIGNSFTYGDGSAVRFYRSDTVTDLNNEGLGGVPALFKSFTDQAGMNFDVYLETRPGSGLDYHLENKLTEIGSQAWDKVMMHGFSTLDRESPGNPATLIATARQMSGFISGRSPGAEIYLTATWSRADLTYEGTSPWTGKPIEIMARDIRMGYDQAAAAAPAIHSVIPVGEAWTRAMQAGVADANPYDGIEAGKVNLWTHDNYHASTHGYYLEALVIFGAVTGLDPRSLGDAECSGYELGLSVAQVRALQQVASDQLSAEGLGVPAATPPAPTATPGTTARPQRCVRK